MKKTLIVLTMAFVSLSVTGQQSMFKALFMFNFAKYIDWPSSSPQDEFIIGIYGNDDIVSELKKLAAARKINNKPIVIKCVKDPSEAKGAHIFYVPQSQSANINKVTTFFNQKPTLIVTDKPSMCSKGALINYITVDGKMKYEVHKQNIMAHNLNVDPKLISLGIEVQ